MIERELKRMFPGIVFHHVNERKIDVSGEEGFILINKANLHNLAHTVYDVSRKYRRGVEFKYETKRDTERLADESSDKSTEEAKELAGANRTVDEAWQKVLATNRTLPNKLRGRHTR